MRIYLYGLPGSGKTTLGIQLAEKLNLDFIDLDKEIVDYEKKSIPEIFSEKGEDYFREVERTIVQTSDKFNEAVIATGGGAPCFFDNETVMSQLGFTVFIDVSPQEIVNRMFNNLQNIEDRPLLNGKSKDQIIEEISNKHQERMSYYSKANVHIKDDNLTIDKLLELVTSSI